MTALVKLKECEDTHLGEEVDRNWAEVVTQQYVFDRLNREVRMSRTNRPNGCRQPHYAARRRLFILHFIPFNQPSTFYYAQGIPHILTQKHPSLFSKQDT